MAKKKNELPAAQEPLSTYGASSELNADVIWELFQETDRMFKETDLKFKETDRLLKEWDKKFEKSSREWDEIKKELGGIGKGNGAIAAFTFDKNVKKEAEEYGFYIFTQYNEKFKILN